MNNKKIKVGFLGFLKEITGNRLQLPGHSFSLYSEGNNPN
jgi:hypothetical protein